MSVTTVSAPPHSTQATTVDASSKGEDQDPSADFASLLLGQLPPAVPPVLPESKDDLHPNVPDETAADPASILAALVAPIELKHGVDSPATPSSGHTALPSVDSLDQSKSVLSAAQQAEDQTRLSQHTAEQGISSTTATDDRPAKLAASTSLASPDDSLLIKNRSSDDIPSLTVTQPFSHSSHVSVNRDSSMTVSTSFRDQNWSTDFNQKIVWLAANDKQSAQLTLNPPQMGPIEVSITVDKGNATASFVSASSDVREAIETALPRLREMFANAGIQLGQTNVGAESFQQQTPDNGANYSASRWVSDNAILAPDSAGSRPARAFAAQQGNGMVDIFA